MVQNATRAYCFALLCQTPSPPPQQRPVAVCACRASSPREARPLTHETYASPKLASGCASSRTTPPSASRRALEMWIGRPSPCPVDEWMSELLAQQSLRAEAWATWAAGCGCVKDTSAALYLCRVRSVPLRFASPAPPKHAETRPVTAQSGQRATLVSCVIFLYNCK